MKILIENYEVIGKVVLNLPPGTITVINGSNGNGKSSLVRAIEYFIRNKVGTSFVKTGATSLKVGFKLDDDRSYIWERTPKETKYVINGRDEKKLNKRSLPEIDPSCGFLIEKDTSGNVIPNIVNERTHVFPFNVSPATTFRIFNRFLGDNKLENLLNGQKEALKELKKNYSASDKFVEMIDKEVQVSKSKLCALSSVDKAIELKNRLVLNRERLREKNVLLQKIERDIARYKTAHSQIERVKPHLALKPYMELGAKLNTLSTLRSVIAKIDFTTSQNKSKQTQTIKNKSILKIKITNIGDAIARLELNKKLLNRIDLYRGEKGRKDLLLSRIATLKEELSQFKSCPLCGNQLGETNVS